MKILRVLLFKLQVKFLSNLLLTQYSTVHLRGMPFAMSSGVVSHHQRQYASSSEQRRRKRYKFGFVMVRLCFDYAVLHQVSYMSRGSLSTKIFLRLVYSSTTATLISRTVYPEPHSQYHLRSISTRMLLKPVDRKANQHRQLGLLPRDEESTSCTKNNQG